MEEKRIGVYVCWCGTNIAKMVDVEGVAEEVGKLPNVVVSKNYKYMCSDPGQELIIKDIKEHNLNRVVVSACSPRIHELTFRKALEHAGLNPYMFEMANIREQVSWVHEDREEATKKAKALVTGAIARVAYHEALDKRTVDVNPASLVIGAGISGLTAALEIADSGKMVYLLEKEAQLGGHTANVDLTFPYMIPARQILEPKIKRVENHPNIEVFKEAAIEEIFGYIGNFNADIKANGKSKSIEFGNIVVATGLKPFDPSSVDLHGYGKLPNVVTSIEFEKMLKSGKIETKDGKEPRTIAIIHCVGSRNNDYHEYCSRTCCMLGLKFSNQIRTALPNSHVYQIYADMRSFGKGCEELYETTAKRGVMFLNFDQREGIPQITKSDPNDCCEMLIDFKERLSNTNIEVPADMVVLLVAMEARDDAKDVAHHVGVSKCGNDFFIERHPKLDPVATTTDGVYIIGSCQGPKDITDSVAQARAASARILATIIQGKVEVELTTAVVNEDLCCGCQTCVSVCPYTAISFDEEKSVSVVNEILCKGCGTCGSACPTGAIRARHFTDLQILSQIKGIMTTEMTEV
ncbi:CoB--CoM heterodisulfide reductase iron-sulfur subunit A family protein [Bacteroidota bacterium]